MDAALTASITATQRLTSNLSWPLTTPKMLHLYPQRPTNPNPRNKHTSLLLTQCSTKPNTDKENPTDHNSTLHPNSNFVQNPPAITPNQPISSSNALFSRGLVFDLGSEKSWDGVEIGSPVVKRYLGDEEERWYMWYHGRSANPHPDSIGLAVSGNGIHWERGGGPVQSGMDSGLVLNCSKDWWAFDTHSIRPCEVVVMSSAKIRANSAVYWLYYTGFSSEKIESFSDNSLGFSLENPERVQNDGNGEIFKSMPGLAMSQDGRHWARIEGEHHTGALLDLGLDGEWDSMFIASPQVVFHGSGDLRMYYHSFDVEKGKFGIGIARSRDGIKWVKLGKIIGGGGAGNFDEFGGVNARVMRNRRDGKYVMAYEGVDVNGRRSIGLAVSPDGLKDWSRVQEGPVLKWAEEDGWDDRGVGSPCLVEMEGEEDEWRLYYRGIGKGGKMGIGMAVSEGSNITSFRRWTGFHL